MNTWVMELILLCTRAQSLPQLVTAGAGTRRTWHSGAVSLLPLLGCGGGKKGGQLLLYCCPSFRDPAKSEQLAVTSFVVPLGASEKMLPAGGTKTCIWGGVGCLGSLTHPRHPSKWDLYQKEALLVEKEEGFLAKSSIVRWVFVKVSAGWEMHIQNRFALQEGKSCVDLVRSLLDQSFLCWRSPNISLPWK